MTPTLEQQENLQKLMLMNKTPIFGPEAKLFYLNFKEKVFIGLIRKTSIL
jgi:hypothetical protein